MSKLVYSDYIFRDANIILQDVNGDGQVRLSPDSANYINQNFTIGGITSSGATLTVEGNAYISSIPTSTSTDLLVSNAGVISKRTVDSLNLAPISGSANYIQAQSSSKQTANAWFDNLTLGGAATYPFVKLNVYQSITGGASSTGSLLQNVSTSTYNYGIDAEATGAGANNVGGFFYVANGTTSNKAIEIAALAAGTNNYALYSGALAKSYFNGSVLIGTTTDAGYKLDVNGIANVRGSLTFGSAGSLFDSESTRAYLRPVNNRFDILNAAGTLYVARFDGVSNGVGNSFINSSLSVGMTTSPTYTLDVAGTGRYTGNLLVTNSNPVVETTPTIVGSTRSGFVTTYLGVDSWGVIGNLQTGEVKVGALRAGGYFLGLYANSFEAVRIHAATRNVSIGNTTDSGYKLDITGTGRFSSTVDVGVTSGSLILGATTTNVKAISLSGYFPNFNAGGAISIVNANYHATVPLITLGSHAYPLAIWNSAGTLTSYITPTGDLTANTGTVTKLSVFAGANGSTVTDKIILGSSSNTTNLFTKISTSHSAAVNADNKLSFYVPRADGVSYHQMTLDGTGQIFINTPATSASVFEVITRNTSTGVLEKVTSSYFAPSSGSDSYIWNQSAVKQTANAWFDNLNLGGSSFSTTGKLNIQTNNTSHGMYLVNTRTTGNNYGFDAEAIGSGATLNVGGFFYATGGITNYGIQIFGPTDGPNNYAIYSGALAQSYFNGNVGIGISTPLYKLDVNGDARINGAIIGRGSIGSPYVGISLGSTLDISNYNFLSTGNHLYINRPSGYDIYIKEGNSTQMWLTTGGTLGLQIAPVPSAGSYHFLTRNTVTGVIEQITLPSMDGRYIQNQNAAAQTSSNFWISGNGRSATLTVGGAALAYGIATVRQDADLTTGPTWRSSQFTVGSTSNNGLIAIGYSSTGFGGIQAGVAGVSFSPLALQYAGDGVLLVGTPTVNGTDRLQVNGNILARSTAATSLTIRETSGNIGEVSILKFEANNGAWGSRIAHYVGAGGGGQKLMFHASGYNSLNLHNGGSIEIYPPTTSTTGYNLLTRNNTSGVIEQIAASSLGGNFILNQYVAAQPTSEFWISGRGKIGGAAVMASTLDVGGVTTLYSMLYPNGGVTVQNPNPFITLQSTSNWQQATVAYNAGGNTMELNAPNLIIYPNTTIQALTGTGNRLVQTNSVGLLSATMAIPTGGWINNQTTQQASSNFNISGAGVIGTNLSFTGVAGGNHTIKPIDLASGTSIIAPSLTIAGGSMTNGASAGGGDLILRGGASWTGGAESSGHVKIYGGINNYTPSSLENGGQVQIYTGKTSVLRWYFSNTGHFLAGADNTYDIGALNATRPRTGYFGTSVNIGASASSASLLVADNNSTDVSQFTNANFGLELRNRSVTDNSWQGLLFSNASTSGAAGIQAKFINKASAYGDLYFFTRGAVSGLTNKLIINSEGLIQLQGQTASHPALKRNGAGIDFRLADDSAYTTITAETGNFFGTGSIRVTNTTDARLIGISGITKGIRMGTTTTGSYIDGVDNTLVGSYQPLTITASTLSLNTPTSVTGTFATSGVNTLSNLAGTGNRFVYATSTGVLTAGIDTSTILTTSSSHYVGTTLIANNRASGIQTITGAHLNSGPEVSIGSLNTIFTDYDGAGILSIYKYLYNNNGVGVTGTPTDNGVAINSNNANWVMNIHSHVGNYGHQITANDGGSLWVRSWSNGTAGTWGKIYSSLNLSPILNQTTQQPTSNFNISDVGVIGKTLNVGSGNAAAPNVPLLGVPATILATGGTDGQANGFGFIQSLRKNNSVGFGVGYIMSLYNSSNAVADYAGVIGVLRTNTAGSHSGELDFHTAINGTLAKRWQINSSGHFLAGLDNTYDFGESVSANRARTGYFGTSLYVGNNSANNNNYFSYLPSGASALLTVNATTTASMTVSSQGSGLRMSSTSYDGNSTIQTLNAGGNLFIRSDNNGSYAGGGIRYMASLNGASHSHIWYTNGTEHLRLTSAGLLTFQGITSSFPAIKRNGAGIDIRTADDGGFADIAAKKVTANNGLFLLANIAAPTLPFSGGIIDYFSQTVRHYSYGVAAVGGHIFSGLDQNGSGYVEYMKFNASGVTISSLAHTGTQMMVADINGVVSKQAIPSYSGANFIVNSSSLQSSSTFNISGDGVMGGSLVSANATIGASANAGRAITANGYVEVIGAATGANTYQLFKNTTTNVAILGTDFSMVGGAGSITNFGTYVYGNNSYFISTNAVKRLIIDGAGVVNIGNLNDSTGVARYVTTTNGVLGYTAIPTPYTHPTSGVSAGTYNNVTVDTYGHVTAGSNVSYLTSFTEVDPIFTAHPTYSITSGNIANWTTAYGWGNHAGLYSLLGHSHAISDITSLQGTLDDKVSLTGTYNNPAWLNQLAWSKITSTPTTLAGYGITDIPISADAATNKYLHWNGSAYVRKQINYSEIAAAPTDHTTAGYLTTSVNLANTNLTSTGNRTFDSANYTLVFNNSKITYNGAAGVDNSTIGGNAANALTIVGGQGGTATSTSGFISGGTGGKVLFTAGKGGTATASSSGYGGPGGDVEFVGGEGGQGSTIAGNGGGISILGGSSGFSASGTSGAGGYASLKGGNGIYGNASGGHVYLIGGAKSGSGIVGNIFLDVSPSSVVRGGNVVIGKNISSGYKLEVGGSVLIDTSLTVTSLNDSSGVAKMVVTTNGLLSYQNVPAGTYISQGTNITLTGSGTSGDPYVINAATGGTGLSDAYTSITDGTTTAAASTGDTIKFRSADNKLSVVVGSNDGTHGDNVLFTLNEANINAATVTNGVYTTGSYSNPSWITSIAAGKISGTLTSSFISDFTSEVQDIGDARYSLTSHNHTLDSLSNVTITSKSIGDLIKWNGTAWVNFIPTYISSESDPIFTAHAAYNVTNPKISNWDTAYTERNQWSGTSTGLTASTGRTSLGGTTVGQNFFTLTNPSAITFIRVNADNTVSTLDAAAFRTAIGAGTSSATVTSVDMTVPTGLTISGAPITTAGTLVVTFTPGYSIPTNIKQGEWDTAYTDRNKWDGGATGLTASTGRTSLGGTTVGQNIFTAVNPSAIRWLRVNADNTITFRTAAETLSDIGAQPSGSYLTGNQTITLSGQATGSGATSISVTLDNAAVIGKVLTGYTSGAGTVAATDTILQAIQKLNGNIGLKQDALSGTGFVKISGTTISYDNSTYLTTSTAASTYQPLDSDLTTIAGLTATTDNFIVSVANAWASRTPAQVRTTLGLVVGTNVQAWDADLDAIAALSGTTGLLRKTAANTWSLDTTAYTTNTGTVTSVSGTGTVNGLTLTGTVTSSGSLTLGGTLAIDGNQITSGNIDASRLGAGSTANGNILTIVGGAPSWIPNAPTWDNITAKPSTVNGYGITDAVKNDGGTWNIGISGNAATVTNGVYTTGNQEIFGVKTFDDVIVGSISGNAATVTNGVYTTGDQSIGGEKLFTWSIVTDNIAYKIKNNNYYGGFGCSALTGNRNWTAPDIGGNICIITTGYGVPSSTPVSIGVIYIDLTNIKVYMSTGISSSADWKILN